MFLWVIMTPFGRPVVPLENGKITISSDGFTFKLGLKSVYIKHSSVNLIVHLMKIFLNCIKY